MQHLNRTEGVKRFGFRATSAQRQEVVAAFARSGVTREEFARQVGISGVTLTRWLDRSSAEGKASTRPAGPKVQLQVFDPGGKAAAGLEIVVSDKLIVRVPAGFDAAELRRLVAVLREGC